MVTGKKWLLLDKTSIVLKIFCFANFLIIFNNKDSNIMRLFLIDESVPKMDPKSKLK